MYYAHVGRLVELLAFEAGGFEKDIRDVPLAFRPLSAAASGGPVGEILAVEKDDGVGGGRLVDIRARGYFGRTRTRRVVHLPGLSRDLGCVGVALNVVAGRLLLLRSECGRSE